MGEKKVKKTNKCKRDQMLTRQRKDRNKITIIIKKKREVKIRVCWGGKHEGLQAQRVRGTVPAK